RDSRTFPTATGRAMLTVNELETIEVPPGRLLLQSVRAHDQFNTTIYSLNDRYRGVHMGRHVLFVNPEDLRELGIADGSYVDVHSEYAGSTDATDRVLRALRIISYPTARGCVSTYFPEANVLVSLESTAEGSNTPVSKSVVVRLEPARAPEAAAVR
ncbi:MAG TPA: molybdopterin dinucleotide binding domain-containing protein, partial [Micrococcaceae bacterium]